MSKTTTIMDPGNEASSTVSNLPTRIWPHSEYSNLAFRGYMASDESEHTVPVWLPSLCPWTSMCHRQGQVTTLDTNSSSCSKRCLEHSQACWPDMAWNVAPHRQEHQRSSTISYTPKGKDSQTETKLLTQNQNLHSTLCQGKMDKTGITHALYMYYIQSLDRSPKWI